MLNELFEYEELNEIMIAVIILEIEEAVIIFLENNPIIKPIGAIINQVKIDENSIFEIKLKDKLIFINMIEINNKSLLSDINNRNVIFSLFFKALRGFNLVQLVSDYFLENSMY